MSRKTQISPRARSARARVTEADARFLLNDASAGLALETRQAVARAYDQTTRLLSIAEHAVDVVSQTQSTAAAEELLRRSHQLQGIAAYATAILGELELEAGRLEALASIKHYFGDAEQPSDG